MPFETASSRSNDYNRGTVYEGGQYIPYSLNSESWTDIPMFIKEGAIIPTQDVQDYVGQETVDHVTVDIFPSGRETSFRYYDDDGETYDSRLSSSFLHSAYWRCTQHFFQYFVSAAYSAASDLS